MCAACCTAVATASNLKQKCTAETRQRCEHVPRVAGSYLVQCFHICKFRVHSQDLQIPYDFRYARTALCIPMAHPFQNLCSGVTEH